MYTHEWYVKHKESINKARRKYLSTHPEIRREIHKRYLSKPENREKVRRYYAKWYKENGRKRNVRQIGSIYRWRKEHPQEILSHLIVSMALNTGELIKPEVCEMCGEKRKLLAHHKCYDRPLDVSWLCYSCHKLLHNENITLQ